MKIALLSHGLAPELAREIVPIATLSSTNCNLLHGRICVIFQNLYHLVNGLNDIPKFSIFPHFSSDLHEFLSQRFHLLLLSLCTCVRVF